MPAANARLIGISEVGHVTAGPADSSWGRTAEEGVTLQLSTETVDLRSGQSYMREHVSLVLAAMQLVVNLVTASLTTFKNLWGIADSALTGDLVGGAPSAEVLTIGPTTLGSVERTLYVLGAGPAGARRVEAQRARVSSMGNISFAKNAYQTPTATWEVLAPDVGAALTITDSV